MGEKFLEEINEVEDEDSFEDDLAYLDLDN